MAPGEKAQFFVISTVCHNVVNKSSDGSHGLEEQRLVFKLKKGLWPHYSMLFLDTEGDPLLGIRPLTDNTWLMTAFDVMLML